jgi:DNA-binding response OmpR family regulator
VWVLVLEPDGRLAHEISEGLEQAGAHVIGPFQNVAVGLDAAGHSWPDCVLLDVQLCDAMGFDPARQLLRLGVPVIFMTGHDARFGARVG